MRGCAWVRVGAPVREGARGCAWVREGARGCARVRVGARGGLVFARVCTRWSRVREGVHEVVSRWSRGGLEGHLSVIV